MTVLSVIIPYYNTKKYTDELMDVLNSQITDEVEVILVDDGSDKPYSSSYQWLKVVRQDNAGVSAARNRGLAVAAGAYIAFIDSDDLVSKDYIVRILETIKGHPDYIELSWKSWESADSNFSCKATATQCLDNPSVCTRVFAKWFIGSLRFNEQKDAGEDEEFTRHIDIKRGRRAFVTSFVYFYRVDVPNSKSKRYRNGLTHTRQIVYHYRTVSASMTDLLEEIKKADGTDEIFVLTMKNEIPELEQYARVRRPMPMWAHELRGEPCDLVKIIKAPVETQVVIYIDATSGFDGITTWITNFCAHMCEYYDITVLYDALSLKVLNSIRRYAEAVKNDKARAVNCDTLLMMRIKNRIPLNITYTRMYQVVHCVKQPGFEILRPKDCIYVSQTSRESFTNDRSATVIHNLPNPEPAQRTLILVSTCRINASDKGDQNNRMIRMARLLEDKGIDFLWFYFSDDSLTKNSHFVRIDPVADVRGYLHMADYLVQLSDSEAYCYAITEALSVGTPVITTPVKVLDELGFIDGVHGHAVPFDLDFDVEKLKDVPHVDPVNLMDSRKMIEQWRSVLGDTEPRRKYIPEELVGVEVSSPYFDMELQRSMTAGEQLEMRPDRAKMLRGMGLIRTL